MFQGTMIDELISTVERVEQKTRQRQEQDQQNATPAPRSWEYTAVANGRQRLN